LDLRQNPVPFLSPSVFATLGDVSIGVIGEVTRVALGVGSEVFDQTKKHNLQVTIHIPVVIVGVASPTTLDEVLDESPVGLGIEPMPPPSAMEGLIAAQEGVEAKSVVSTRHGADPMWIGRALEPLRPLENPWASD